MTFDYVIAGAGSAGCVLANRLSADPAITVCLIEAGGDDRHPYVHMPRGVGKLMAMRSHMWFYATEPHAHTAMKPDTWLRGKVLGGSSSVNGMVWVRGQPADFDALAAQTSDDWNWANIGRAYEQIECHALGAAPSRGGSGPLRISLPTFRNALSEAILAAGERIGWSVKQDVNLPDAGDGVGYMPRSIWRGKRQSAAVAFLRPIAGRRNLTILTDAVVDTVRFEGARATGVTILQRGGRRMVEAVREVVLSAGAIASPGILERSGVGDPRLLEPLGIPLFHANAAVGEHASEHRALRMQWRLKHRYSLNREYAGWRLIRNVVRYYLTGDGPMSAVAIDMRAAFRSGPDLDRPDIQTQFGLYSWDIAGRGNGLENADGFCAVINPLRPVSTGSIHITSRDPKAPPAITAGYGLDPGDRAVTIAAARSLRRLAAQQPLEALIAAETVPGPDATTDEAILAALDNHGVAGMHTVGSCRMGRDAASVVDAELRVRGVARLRVVDASVFPFIPSGNTNAPTIALAWRAAEIIKKSL